MVLTMLNKKVSDVMMGMGKFPVIQDTSSLKNALDEMTAHKLGMACIIDASKILIGVITDGDLRRILLLRQDPLPALLVSNALVFSNNSPHTIRESDAIEKCLIEMKNFRISDLPVVNEKKQLVGIVHFHDLID